MPRETIIVDNRFRRLEREIEAGIHRGLARGARAGATAARAAQNVQGDLEITSTAAYEKRSRSGKRLIAADVVARDFKAVFFQFGTLGKRKRKLAPRTRRTPRAQAIAAKGGGIRPRYFLSKGLRAGFPTVLRELQQELSRLR